MCIIYYQDSIFFNVVSLYDMSYELFDCKLLILKPTKALTDVMVHQTGM